MFGSTCCRPDVDDADAIVVAVIIVALAVEVGLFFKRSRAFLKELIQFFLGVGSIFKIFKNN